MSSDIKIKKGLTLRLAGEAEKIVSEAPRSKLYSVKPSDFYNLIPKMVVQEGATVKAGSPLFYAKNTDTLKIVSPVSGTVKEIRRGAKRVILEVLIEADSADEYIDFGLKSPDELSAEEVKQHLLASGCWAFIKQRPYDILANPADVPKAIFISAVATAPLAADIEFILKDRKTDFQTGIHALAKLTPGTVHLSIEKDSSSYLKEIEGVQLHQVSGPHPAGNVGVQIHHIDPINLGERVWVVRPEDVAIIGNFFRTGKFNATRIVAVAGSEINRPQYYKIKAGAAVANVAGAVSDSARIISGDVLTGENIGKNGFLGYHHNLITAIPEGKNYRLLGWLPFKDNNIPSMSKTSFSWLFPRKKYTVNTNLNGEERALVVTGEMEKVLPMNIFPMQLLKACMAGNIEKMEQLGIYEIAPEDVALIDFSNTSKIDAQEIIREGLDVMIQEVG
jgi:Na+-transporting NADH:ubiquinone oxidoreductase subunit A